MSQFAKNFHERLIARHDAYMRKTMEALKKIRKEEGKDAALLVLAMHEIEGDSMLVDSDWNLLKLYVEQDKWHEENPTETKN